MSMCMILEIVLIRSTLNNSEEALKNRAHKNVAYSLFLHMATIDLSYEWRKVWPLATCDNQLFTTTQILHVWHTKALLDAMLCSSVELDELMSSAAVLFHLPGGIINKVFLSKQIPRRSISE